MSDARYRRPEARRPRLQEAVRGLRRREGHQGSADRHSGEDQEGLRHGRRRRVAHDVAPGRRSSTSTRCMRSATASQLPLSNKQVERSGILQAGGRQRGNSATCARRRAALGGYMPARRARSRRLPVPPLQTYAEFALRGDGKEMSTTMAIVRLFSQFAQGQRARPAHRSDRRGRSPHFRHGEPVQTGRHLLAGGQLYEPEDAGSMLYYRKRATVNCWRRGSPRRARSRHGPRRRPPTASMTSRCCRSISTIRCSAFSASAI